MRATGFNAAILRGVRVLDFGHALAGPFAATMLADFGADVIKVERPGTGDAMRYLGPETDSGRAWWKSMARGKRCLALDWKRPESRPVIEKMVRNSQVFLESFRPGVLERNGLGPDVLHGWNRDLVILRVSGYGQAGPYRERPGFGKAAEAFSGLCDLTGFPSGPPMHPGFPMGDMTTGLMGAFGIMLALRGVSQGLGGQVIDLAIYEAPMRLIDYHVPVRTGTSAHPKRNGNRQPMSFAPSGVYQTRDGRWITYSAATLSVARRVLSLIGARALAELADLPAISAHDDEIDRLMKEWVGSRSLQEVMHEFRGAEAVAELVHDVDDILADPHIGARANIVKLDGEACSVVNVVPRMSSTPGEVRWLGRDLGQDTREILIDVADLDEEQIGALMASGAVSAPTPQEDHVLSDKPN